MRASLYEGSRTFRTAPATRPTRAQDQALLRVLRAGICGTDLHIFQGHLDHRIPKGGIIGHETFAEVVEAPAGGGFGPGDRVVEGAHEDGIEAAAQEVGLALNPQELGPLVLQVDLEAQDVEVGGMGGKKVEFKLQKIQEIKRKSIRGATSDEDKIVNPGEVNIQPPAM